MDPSEKLAVFTDLKASGTKLTWGERRKLIEATWPSIASLDWDKALHEDIDMLGEVVRDIIKLDHAEPGRDGPRPPLDPARAKATLRRMMGEDYSIHPFDVSFRALAGELSYRALARKCFISLKKVHLYMTGKAVPPVDEMNLIAKAFNKHPSFFLEYRVTYVGSALEAGLTRNPESSIGFYRRVTSGNS